MQSFSSSSPFRLSLLSHRQILRSTHPAENQTRKGIQETAAANQDAAATSPATAAARIKGISPEKPRTRSPAFLHHLNLVATRMAERRNPKSFRRSAEGIETLKFSRNLACSRTYVLDKIRGTIGF